MIVCGFLDFKGCALQSLRDRVTDTHAAFNRGNLLGIDLTVFNGNKAARGVSQCLCGFVKPSVLKTVRMIRHDYETPAAVVCNDL